MPVGLGGLVVNLFWPRVKQPAIGIELRAWRRSATREGASHCTDAPRLNDEYAAPRVGFAAVRDTGQSGER